MFPKIKIRTKLILLLVSLSLIPFIIIGFTSLRVSRTALSNQAFAQLTSIRDSKKTQIERYFQKVNSDISVLANSSHIVAALDAFSSALNDGVIDETQYSYFESLEYGDSFHKFNKEYGYYDMLLITKDGDIVYSLKRESDLSENVINGPLKKSNLGNFFYKGMKTVVITDFELYPPSGNRPISFVISPIVLLDSTEGVIVLKLNNDIINTIMQERSGMGKTSEAYLVGPDNLMRSDSHLSPKSHTVKASFANPEKGSVDTKASRDALSGKSGQNSIDNYRDVRVLSAYIPFHFHNTTYALIAEINEEEAFGAINRLKNLMIIVALVIVVFILFISFIMANEFTKPIIMLTASSIEIAEGKLDKKIEDSGDDELGILARNFKNMRDSIREKISALDTEIRERERAEEDLRQMSKVFMEAADPILIEDLKGRTIEMNEEAERSYGWSREELIGQPITTIVPPERHEQANNLLAQCKAGENLRNVDGLRQTREGKIIPVLLTLSLLKDERGQARSIATIAKDISAQKQAERELLTAHDELEQRVEERTAELRKLSTAVEQSPASVVITNPQGIIEYVNPKFTQVTGYAAEEAIGENPRILKSGENPPEVYEELWNTITSGNEWRGEFLNKKKGGELYWEAVSISPITSADGSITHYLAVKEDITARKEMEESIRESEARFRGYFENSQIGIAVTSPDMGWIEVNKQLQKMLGYSLEEFRQMTRTEYTHPDDLEVDMTHFEKILAGEIDNYMIDKRFIRKDGDIVYTNVTVSCVRGEKGGIINILASLLDITERKQMEEDLQARVKELDEAQSAILNMMEDLDEEKQKAEAATQAKSDFLANMSHEIRTPINAIMGMTHLALKTDLTLKQRDYVTKTHTSAQNLLGIINDILDFSKIEAGKLDMEWIDFNLDDVLDDLADLITVKAQKKSDLEILFAIRHDVPRFLVGDPLRLKQVLINLANNAVKFTESGEIVISTELVKRDEDHVTVKFAVSDSGIGIGTEQKKRLFDAFSQADTTTTRKFGGTGLGLAISKQLVNRMKGEVWVDSEPGKGSTFSFTAQFGLGQEKTGIRFRPSPDLTGMHTLVIDDNSTSRDILKNMLESFSFNVTLAASAKEGLTELENAIGKTPFDLVIMDWKMPEMDGIAASEQIKNHPRLAQIPKIIMVTAYGGDEILKKTERLGLEGLLFKPVNPSLLFDAIMQAFGKETPQVPDIDRKVDQRALGSKPIQGASILLVEDNEMNRQVAREILEDAGGIVSLAVDGREAFKAVIEDEYDAVLMDVQMPVMDGYEATRRIREWESNTQSSIPIIAMTAHAMKGDEEKSLEAGMNDHITKPIDPDLLLETLLKWIGPRKRLISSQQMDAVSESPYEGESLLKEDYLPSSLDGFNLTEGLKRLRGNQRLYRQLLLNFSVNYLDVIDKIRKALDEKDLERARSIVHDLKGIAGNLSAVDLLAATTDLWRLLKAQDPDKDIARDSLDQKMQDLHNNLRRALKALQVLAPSPEQIFDEVPSEKTIVLPVELTKAELDSIQDAAEMGDIAELISIAKNIASRSDDFIQFSESIIQWAESFDFDRILKLIS